MAYSIAMLTTAPLEENQPHPTQRAAWCALRSHHQEVGQLRLSELFSDDDQRATMMSVKAGQLYLDYSRVQL